MNGFNLKSMLPVMAVMLLIGLITSGKLEPFYFWFFLLSGAALVSWTAYEAGLMPKAVTGALNSAKAHKQAVEEESKENEIQRRHDEYARRLQNYNANDVVRQLSRQVYGQKILLENVAYLLEEHFLKTAPEKPLVISLFAPRGYGKERLASEIAVQIGAISGEYRPPLKTEFGALAQQVEAISKHKGVVVLKEIGAEKNGNLPVILSGEGQLADPYLIVILIKDVPSSVITRIARDDKGRQAALSMKVAQEEFGDAVFKKIDAAFCFHPMGMQETSLTLWRSVSEAAYKQMGIHIEQPAREDWDDFAEWIFPYVNEIFDGAGEIPEMRQKVLSGLTSDIKQAKLSSLSRVSPQIQEGQLTLVSAEPEQAARLETQLQATA
ncbi:hypothetical protein [Roseibium aggregatum]|uniref:Uncharacterized protein n=1 Tax=Roseibium aggregatum TaxID=187304 RepID=A0A0M6YC80_9HYPH|nr:hypothetical protein [Roseibium aggregatum]CTQ47314.1 hypothetical protein LAL4801_05776 [Roseibium aggregatum]